MATYSDEPVDSYYYSSYNPYMSRYSRPKDAGWKYKSYLSHYGDTSEAFSNHQRAQLKSILSQINPKLTPRLRKANTKDVAVQVYPKRDASVQCSIGPRTLLAMKRDLRRRRKQDPASPGGPSKIAGVIRYPRTTAVYSPIAFRSVTSFLVDENSNDNPGGETRAAESPGEPPGEVPGQPSEPAEECGVKSEANQAEDVKTAKIPEPRERPIKSKQTSDAQISAEGSKGKARVRFQVRQKAGGGLKHLIAGRQNTG